MLVVAANQMDEDAVSIAGRWQSFDAVLLTAADLSASGWRYCFPHSGRPRAIIAGRQLAIGEIVGVLTRMPCIYEQELGHIVPGDRSYVAAEMTAFLLAWLSSLACPVLNRPTPDCLAGPNWRGEQWVRLAAGLGIPVRPLRRIASRRSDELTGVSICEVIVVGNQCFGDVAPQLCSHARRLAGAAGAELLAIQFTGPESGSQFVNAHLWPNLASPEVADAVLGRLLGSSRC
jgi:hypothetical protein